MPAGRDLVRAPLLMRVCFQWIIDIFYNFFPKQKKVKFGEPNNVISSQ